MKIRLPKNVVSMVTKHTELLYRVIMYYKISKSRLKTDGLYLTTKQKTINTPELFHFPETWESKNKRLHSYFLLIIIMDRISKVTLLRILYKPNPL